MKKTKPSETTLTPYFDEREKRINEDHRWCETDEAVRKKYGGKIVAVYNRKIFGAGKHHGEAWDVLCNVSMWVIEPFVDVPPRILNWQCVYVPYLIPGASTAGRAVYHPSVPMPTTTIFKASLFPLPTPAVHYICETWWTCSSGSGNRYEYRERFDSLLSTAELLSRHLFLAREKVNRPGDHAFGWQLARGHVRLAEELLLPTGARSCLVAR